MCSLNSGKLFEETGKGQYINTDSNPNAEPLQTQEPTESTNQEGSGYTFNVDNVYGGLPEVRRYDETHTPPNELGFKMNTNEELLNNISEQPQSVQLSIEHLYLSLVSLFIFLLLILVISSKSNFCIYSFNLSVLYLII